MTIAMLAELDLPRIHAALQDCPVGHTVDYHLQVASTMPLAHQRATDPTVRSGTLVVAEEQTAGRGRRQRRWETPPGQALLISLILKPPLPFPIQQIPMAAGLVAVAAITKQLPELQGQVGLKWPNDLLIGHNMADAGKIGGILIESNFYGAALGHVIVGMGLNVQQAPAMLPQAPPGAPSATSLRHYMQSNGIETAENSKLDRTALLIALCQTWATLLDPTTLDPTQAAQTDATESPNQIFESNLVWQTATAGSPLAIVARWRHHLWTLGHKVAVQVADTAEGSVPPPICGTAVDVTNDGQLVVHADNGDVHTFDAGDVSVRMARPASSHLPPT
ncbi:MAG: biotin--[acetyl-CoA-carboxylase] ligase [Caldilineaceae bacterium]